MILQIQLILIFMMQVKLKLGKSSRVLAQKILVAEDLFYERILLKT